MDGPRHLDTCPLASLGLEAGSRGHPQFSSAPPGPGVRSSLWGWSQVLMGYLNCPLLPQLSFP